MAFVPDGPELGGWQKDGAHQYFEGEDLFIYIDGGAEIYFEYGFKRVIVQDYRDGSGNRISVEVFEMDSPESAYGMFTFKSSPRGETCALGDECRLSDYYMNLWKGRYLVTITGLDQDSASKPALVALARLVEKKLSGKGRRPALLSLLPEEDLYPKSLKFFKGPLALYNIYPFFRDDAFSFQTGISGDYATGGTLFLLEYADRDAASAKFSGVRGKFSAEPKFRDVNWDGGLLTARDDKGRSILAGQSGRYIVIVLVDGEGKTAETLMTRVEKRLSAGKEE